MKKLKFILLAALLAVGTLSIPAEAVVTYAFHCITYNDSTGTNAGIGESQLWVDVEPFGSGQVLFRFRNEGPEAAVITDVYFMDGVLLGISELIDCETGGHDGVDFHEGANPNHLPGGNKITASFTQNFPIEPDNPQPVWGVGPGEWLGVVFDVTNGNSFQNMITALADQTVQIGIHVQAFAHGDDGESSDGSESFINNPEPIPAPGAILLGGIGIVLVGWLRRRRAL